MDRVLIHSALGFRGQEGEAGAETVTVTEAEAGTGTTGTTSPPAVPLPLPPPPTSDGSCARSPSTPRFERISCLLAGESRQAQAQEPLAGPSPSLTSLLVLEQQKHTQLLGTVQCLDVSKLIGKGAFSSVMLAQHRASKDVYAVKVDQTRGYMLARQKRTYHKEYLVGSVVIASVQLRCPSFQVKWTTNLGHLTCTLHYSCKPYVKVFPKAAGDSDSLDQMVDALRGGGAEAVYRSVRSERRLLYELPPHPFVVSLYATLQDHASLYMVLSFCQGGELRGLMEQWHTRDAAPVTTGIHSSASRVTWVDRWREMAKAGLEGHLRQGLPEQVVRFYGTCIVLALTHLHDHGVVFCDLKASVGRVKSVGGTGTHYA